MKMISDIFKTELKTYEDIARISETVAIKQRDAKRIAIDYVIGEWKRLVEAKQHQKSWFEIVVGYRCTKCNGIILKHVGPFSSYTTGGNQSVGCPVCCTIHSNKMLSRREDIIKLVKSDIKC